MAKINIPGSKQNNENEEGWAPYIGRNIAQAPVNLLSLLSSGGGVGDILNTLAERYEAPENIKKWLSSTIPSTGQARENISGIVEGLLPENISNLLTNRKPEDYWPQRAIEEVATAVPFGAFKSLPNLAKYAYQRATAGTGAAAGKEIGGGIGNLLGHKEVGEILGGLGGGVAANTLAQNLLPSQHFPKKLHEKELKKAKQEHHEAQMALPKSKVKFSEGKKAKVEKERARFTGVKEKTAKLNKERNRDYRIAKKLSVDEQGNPIVASGDSLKNAIEKVSKGVKKGVSSSDMEAIEHNINSVSKYLEENNGKMSLSDAIEFQKNLNDQLYRVGGSTKSGQKTFSNTFKKYTAPVVEELNNFIEKNSSPLFYQAFKKAENASKEIFKLNEFKKELVPEIKQNISDIRREQFSPIIAKELMLNAQDKSKALKELGSANYNKLFKKPENLHQAVTKLVEKVGPMASVGVSGWLAKMFLPDQLANALIGTAYVGSNILRQGKIAKEIFKQDPRLFKDWTHALANATQKITPVTVRQFAKYSNELEDKINKESKPKAKIKLGSKS